MTVLQRYVLSLVVRRPGAKRLLSTSTALELVSTRYGDPAKDRAHPPLVICHGLFGNKNNWNSVSKAMQRRLGSTIYCLDLRNHGESPWSDEMSYDDMSEDVVAFLRNISKETGFSKFHLLGHSMGGRLAMRMAVDRTWQQLIDRLIVEDVSPRAYELDFTAHVIFRKYIHAMAAMDLTKSRREILKELEDIVPDIGVRQFLLTNLAPSDVRGVSRWKCNLQAIDKNLESLLRYNVPEGVFERPTLFVYGKKSEYIKEKDQGSVRSIFPSVQYDGISDAGHWVHAEQPYAFMDSICNFLTR
ncbi:hydrolase, alpha/beta domain protein [Oesophagostomum dentatum]|uniref:sn-1-specific diacylglycerol lipase ABHD11 n=1 Tax=Oesophagostomum dentatum TaxID=61180 RepID=A0A0B1SWC0_OESDE|nr:hydrolase, alpha/beta domain protein [Oesophagostomum dentatum]